MNADTLMCKRHEANYIQFGNRNQYSHLSKYEQTQSTNNSDNSVKRDLDDFIRSYDNMRTVHDNRVDHKFYKPIDVAPQKGKSNLKPLSSRIIVKQDQPQSETDLEKFINNSWIVN